MKKYIIILGILLLTGCVTQQSVPSARIKELITSQMVDNDSEFGDGWNSSLNTLQHQLEGN